MKCVAIISRLESSLFIDGVTLRSAAKLTWWLSDLMSGKGINVTVGSSGNTVDVVYNF